MVEIIGEDKNISPEEKNAQDCRTEVAAILDKYNCEIAYVTNIAIRTKITA